MAEPSPAHDDPRDEPLTMAGERYIVRDCFGAGIALALALGAAQTPAWLDAWVYAAVILAIKGVSAVLLLRTNPAVLNARGTKHEMSARERIFFAVYVPAVLAMPVVAGLDVGRPGWTHRSPGELAARVALVAAGAGFVIRALALRVREEREGVPVDRLDRIPALVGAPVQGAGAEALERA